MLFLFFRERLNERIDGALGATNLGGDIDYPVVELRDQGKQNRNEGQRQHGQNRI